MDELDQAVLDAAIEARRRGAALAMGPPSGNASAPAEGARWAGARRAVVVGDGAAGRLRHHAAEPAGDRLGRRRRLPGYLVALPQSGPAGRRHRRDRAIAPREPRQRAAFDRRADRRTRRPTRRHAGDPLPAVGPRRLGRDVRQPGRPGHRHPARRFPGRPGALPRARPGDHDDRVSARHQRCPWRRFRARSASRLRRAAS